MEESKYANLIWHNKKSTDFGIKIAYPFNPVHPTPDLQATHITGRNGDFIQDEQSYQNVTETFNLIVDKNPLISQSDWLKQVMDWLDPLSITVKQYEYLKFDIDPNYSYSAVIQTPPIFSWDTGLNQNLATGTLAFYCEPFQYRDDGINYINLPDSGVVYNPELMAAMPNWHFVANGSFTLTINDLPYEFDNMEGEFWINGDTGDTYDAKNNLMNSQTHFPNLEPPTLLAGKNTISITSGKENVTKAEYQPRWRRLI